MSLISGRVVFTTGGVIYAADHNNNDGTIWNDYNGNITNANISGSANISDTKFSQISSSGKVNGSALTSLSSTPSGAGIFPSANVFSPGMIILWSGTITTIPTGWLLCDGSNSTPDLRNRFVVCANADDSGTAKSTITGVALQSGGSVTISTNNMPSHSHTIRNGAGTQGTANNFVLSMQLNGGSDISAISSTGGGTAYTQPFYALAYIMKS